MIRTQADADAINEAAVAAGARPLTVAAGLQAARRQQLAAELSKLERRDAAIQTGARRRRQGRDARRRRGLAAYGWGKTPALHRSYRGWRREVTRRRELARYRRRQQGAISRTSMRAPKMPGLYSRTPQKCRARRRLIRAWKRRGRPSKAFEGTVIEAMDTAYRHNVNPAKPQSRSERRRQLRGRNVKKERRHLKAMLRVNAGLRQETTKRVEKIMREGNAPAGTAGLRGASQEGPA